MKTWTAEQAATFLEAVASDRLGAAFSSRCTGFVAVEVLGLRWSDVDLDAKTITIRMTRVLVVGAGVVEGEPKTERGRRTLPLDDGLAAALRSLEGNKHGTDWQQGRLTPRAVATVIGSIWLSTSWAIRTGRSGTGTGSPR
jgi:integrase